MVIAIPYTDGTIEEHFCSAKELKIYSLVNRELVSAKVHPVTCCQDTYDAIKQHSVSCILCKHISSKLFRSFAKKGMDVYCGVSGDADHNIEKFTFGEFKYDDDEQCDNPSCPGCKLKI